MSERYFGDVLGSYANGVQLDLRVKLAVDFLKSPMFHGFSVTDAARQALDVATALLDLAQARDLVASLPDTNELSAPMRRHIERQMRAQIAGQVAGQAIAADEAPKISTGGMVRQ